MTMSGYLHMPSLGGAAGWLNSPPLSPAELRGRVTVINFWTLTCINWLRQEPYVRAWSRAYRDDGLVVIGVHTPEFFFERDIDLVRQAISDARREGFIGDPEAKQLQRRVQEHLKTVRASQSQMEPAIQ